jgi:hypothetical protein
MNSVYLDENERMLVDVLGFENVASPYVDDLVVKEGIVAQFLENICIHEHKRAEAWLSDKYGDRSKEMMRWLPAGANPLDVKLKNGNGLIIPLVIEGDSACFELAIRKIITGCDYYQLGNYLGEKVSGRPVNNVALRQDVSRVVAPECLDIKGRKFLYTDVIFSRNYSKKVDSGVVCYRRDDGRYVLLPLLPYQEYDHNIPIYFLSLGVYDLNNSMLNADVMNSNKNSNVLLFANLKMANDFSFSINDSSLKSADDYIATSHYGGSEFIDRVDFSSIRGQNVYFIPYPTKEGYLNVFKYAEKCISVGSNSVKIFIDPVLEFEKNDTHIDSEAITCPFLRFVTQNAFCYKDKDLLPMIRRIMKFSISYEWYRSWAQEHMLINDESSKSTDLFSSCVTDGSEMIKKPLIDKDESNVSLHNILSHDKFSMAVGFSHEGKTLFSMSLILSYISGIDMFLFNNNKRGKVLLIDSESGGDFVHEVLLQLSKAYGVKESVLSSFKYMSLLEMPPEFAKDFDLLSEPTQLQLKKYVQDNGINLIVLDNLQSMFENVTNSPKMLRLLIKFMELMQSIRVSILLLHHTLDSNKRKPQGLTQLVNRMRNIMLLEGYSTLMPELMKLKEGEVGDPFVQKFIDHKGVTFRLVFTKCNSYQHLRNQKFLYHLHYKNVRKCIPTKWICDTDEYHHLDDDCNQIKDDINCHNCCDSDSCVDDAGDVEIVDNFQNYCNIVQSYAQDHPDFNSKHIQAEFYLSKREAKKVLDHLVDSGILNKTGTTSNRRYRIRF